MASDFGMQDAVYRNLIVERTSTHYHYEFTATFDSSD
jgi:hypothetical protein